MVTGILQVWTYTWDIIIWQHQHNKGWLSAHCFTCCLFVVFYLFFLYLYQILHGVSCSFLKAMHHSKQGSIGPFLSSFCTKKWRFILPKSLLSSETVLFWPNHCCCETVWLMIWIWFISYIHIWWHLGDLRWVPSAIGELRSNCYPTKGLQQRRIVISLYSLCTDENLWKITCAQS